MKFAVVILSVLFFYSSELRAQDYIKDHYSIREINVDDYRLDTIRQFYNFLWETCLYPQASYYTLAYRKGESYISEDYYVQEKQLRAIGTFSDRSLKTRHGQFLFYKNDGTLEKQGRYAFGKKNNWWLEYFSDGVSVKDSTFYVSGVPAGRSVTKHINGALYVERNFDRQGRGSGSYTSYYLDGSTKELGRYSNGLAKDSIWSLYHRNGKLSFLQYFKNDSLYSQTCFDSAGIPLDTCIRLRRPEFPGGAEALRKYLRKNTSFPRGFEFTVSPLTVLVGYTIDIDGSVTDVKVVKSLHPVFDKEALRVVEKFPKWNPALMFNELIRFETTMPFYFIDRNIYPSRSR